MLCRLEYVDQASLDIFRVIHLDHDAPCPCTMLSCTSGHAVLPLRLSSASAFCVHPGTQWLQLFHQDELQMVPEYVLLHMPMHFAQLHLLRQVPANRRASGLHSSAGTFAPYRYFRLSANSRDNLHYLQMRVSKLVIRWSPFYVQCWSPSRHSVFHLFEF